MADREQILKIVGQISSLDEPEPWTTGLSTLFEWTTWQTEVVLGISKTALVEEVVDAVLDNYDDAETRDTVIRRIEKGFTRQKQANIVASRTDRTRRHGLIGPYEALRRARFFSEDYLNREFDVFISLVPDQYLNEFYGQLFPMTEVGTWRSHGNTTQLMENVRQHSMQFDSLAYNREARRLVANELKLSGGKNRDQILKHILMYLRLKDAGFVDQADVFQLLFIGTAPEQLGNSSELIEQEFKHCAENPKKWFTAERDRLRQEAGRIEISALTWEQFIEFNESYLAAHPEAGQTLDKLISGMNATLREKAAINGSGVSDPQAE